MICGVGSGRRVPLTLLPFPRMTSESHNSLRLATSGTESMVLCIVSAICSSTPPLAAMNRSTPTSISFLTNAELPSRFRRLSSLRAALSCCLLAMSASFVVVSSVADGALSFSGSGVFCLLKSLPSWPFSVSACLFPFSLISSSGLRSS